MRSIDPAGRRRSKICACQHSPEGAVHPSPGQRLGFGFPPGCSQSPEGARQDRSQGHRPWTALSGLLACVSTFAPGRWPGLWWIGPSGLPRNAPAGATFGCASSPCEAPLGTPISGSIDFTQPNENTALTISGAKSFGTCEDASDRYMYYLSKALHVSEEVCPMACLSAYFDKGGDVDAPVIIVAGFVAEPDCWDQAGKEWKQATGLEDFHMSDLRPEEKDLALKNLAGIAKRYHLTPIAAGTYTRAFATANLGSSKPFIGDAYRLCCLQCVIATSEWAKDVGEPCVDLVFDLDGKLYNKVTEEYDEAAKRPNSLNLTRISSFSRANRQRAKGIQLADALAHSLFSFHRRRILEDPDLDMGPSLRAIAEGAPEGWLFTKPAEVEHWAEVLDKAFQVAPSLEN